MEKNKVSEIQKINAEVIEKLMTAGSMDELNAIVAQFKVQDEAVIITAIGKLLN